MAGAEFTNWDQERESLIEDIMSILRDQRDDKQHLTLSGKVVINVGVFSTGSNFVTGPVPFDTPFDGEPTITFGEVVSSTEASLPVKGSGYAALPLLVHPYVRSYVFNSGKYSGFYLGVVKDTPVPSGIVQHTVSWRAEGKGTAYVNENRVTEQWTESYEQNDPSFLQENATSEDDY